MNEKLLIHCLKFHQIKNLKSYTIQPRITHQQVLAKKDTLGTCLIDCLL